MIEKLAFQGLFLYFGVPNTSHKLQVMDHNPNKEHQRIYLGLLADFNYVASTPSKAHIVECFVKAGRLALTPENIRAGWTQTGIYPWDPEKIKLYQSLIFGADIYAEICEEVTKISD
jgi:hypothetical protein